MLAVCLGYDVHSMQDQSASANGHCKCITIAELCELCWLQGDRVPFATVGVSSVMHPLNPHCPTMHFNYRWVVAHCPNQPVFLSCLPGFQLNCQAYS